MNQHLEEGSQLQLDFSKISAIAAHCAGVIPVAVQNIDTREVILVAYLNEEALHAAINQRKAIFWSTSRNQLWEKGKTSGETFELKEIYVNCEQNAVLFMVRPQRGGICHTKNSTGNPRNCFYRKLNLDTWELENIDP